LPTPFQHDRRPIAVHPITKPYSSISNVQLARLEYIERPMVDFNEIAALKASTRGTVRSAEELRDLAERVEAFDPHAEVSDNDLEDLRRVTSAHAVAAQALRGFVETMLRRRGKLQDAAVGGSTADEEP
jgi:hypothetical protein